MAPDVKRIINQSIYQQETRSVINRVMEDKLEREGDSEVQKIKDPAIRQMVDDLLESNKAGSLTEEEEANIHTKRLAGRVDEDGKKYDKPPMSDEEYEGYAVWIKTDDADDAEDVKERRQYEESESAKELAQKFGEYVHHQYVKRWGLFEERDGKNEEWFIPDPKVLEEDDPDYLCDMCRHIDFHALFTQRGLPGNDIPGPARIRLHGFNRVLKRENCSFCRLIARKVRAEGILDFENEHVMKGMAMKLHVLDEGPAVALRLEVELDDIRRLPQPIKIIMQQVSDQDSAPFHGIFVDPGKVSTAALQKWRSLCEDHHPEIADRCLSQKQAGLRLIDVNEHQVVRVDGPCRYVCLSYVWGTIRQPQYTSETQAAFGAPRGLDSELIQLPRTIRDAILVTKQLGINYIWIDALCIEQDDEVDKAAIIADMGAIYSNSILTIVASTNSDPSAGLPGVSATCRNQTQIREKVQGLQLAIAFHDHRKPLHDVENSVWNSRAWTYQEWQLSQRMLFFTDSQMCFLCPHATLFEDTWPITDSNFKTAPILDRSDFYQTPMEIWMKVWQDPTQYRFENKAFETEGGLTIMVGEEENENSELSAPVYRCRQIHDNDTSAMPRIRGQNMWNIYRKAVNSFTCRNITSNADTVNAFAGMTELIRQGTNTKFWYGIPAFAFDQALLWYPREQLRRRRDRDGSELFPSWSWAGWKGACHYRGRGWHNGLYRCPVSAVHWLQTMDPIKFFARLGDTELTGPPEGLTTEQMREDILSGKWKLLEQISTRELYRFDFEECGWESIYDKERNQHGYTHTQYPDIVFNYPIPLPNQEVMSLPDSEGALRFQAYCNKIRFCDMNTTPHVKETGVEKYLQLGLNDRGRSATYRPSWQRIIYHQGYRAGFLFLNIPFEDLNLSKQDDLSLVALSRDEIPRTAPPSEGWDLFRALGPVELVWNLGRKLQWLPSKLAESIQMPNEEVDPDVKPKAENGDAFYDEYRYQSGIFELYNVILVRKREQKGETCEERTEKGPWNGNQEGWERIGVGKMHWSAFHHAGPEMESFLLR
jgi:hypothetical protein